MAQAVVGLMDDFDEGRAALGDLAAAGFTAEQIVRRGATVLIATAQTEAMAESAIDILERHGAVAAGAVKVYPCPTAADQAAFNERVSW
jgi:hypothetical protein